MFCLYKADYALGSTPPSVLEKQKNRGKGRNKTKQNQTKQTKKPQ